MYSYGPPHMAEQKQDDQHEPRYSSLVRIRDVALRTCQKRLTIGRSGERGSGISVLAARHDDDGDDAKIITLISYLSCFCSCCLSAVLLRLFHSYFSVIFLIWIMFFCSFLSRTLCPDFSFPTNRCLLSFKNFQSSVI